MPPFTDPGVQGLYFLVMDPGEPMINDMQRDAITGPGDLARRGKGEARAARSRVARRPDLHPKLREGLSILEMPAASAETCREWVLAVLP